LHDGAEIVVVDQPNGLDSVSNRDRGIVDRRQVVAVALPRLVEIESKDM
jgi:hypothetical protein